MRLGITLAELFRGTRRLPEGKRRNRLERHRRFLEEDFAGRTLAFDTGTAATWGEYMATQESLGNLPDTFDSFIAAIALHWELTVATRNTADFPGVPTVNPFE